MGRNMAGDSEHFRVAAEIELATRNAVRDILLGDEGQLLMTRVAEEAAHHAVTDFMLKIGMDTTTPAAIIALQADMHHLRWWNKVVSSGASRMVAVIIGIAAMFGWGFLASELHNYIQYREGVPIHATAPDTAHADGK